MTTDHPVQTESANLPIASSGQDKEQRQRRPNPLNVAYDLKRTEIEENIARLQKRLDLLKTGDDGSLTSMKGERGRLIGELKELREKIRTVREEANGDMKLLKDIQAQIKKQKDEVKEQKDKLAFKSVGEIDSRISTLDRRIETGDFASLIEEKQILQDISKLKKARKALEQLSSGASIDGRPNDIGNLKMKEELYRGRMALKFAEVDELRKKIDIAESEMAKLDSGKEAMQQKQKHRLNEVENLKKEIDAAYEARRKLLESHREAKQKQRETWERMQVKREEEEKRRRVERQIDDLEHRLRSLNPALSIDLKIEECVNLNNYFSSLFVGNQIETTAAKNAARPSAEDGEYVVLKPKTGREEVFCRTGSGKAKKHHVSAPSSSTALGKLPIHIISGLADLQLPLPSNLSDLPPIVDSLKQKKEEYEKQRQVAMAGIKNQQAELQSQIAALQAEL